MPTIKANPFISMGLWTAAPADVAAKALVTRDFEAAAREKWQEFIDNQLIEWGRDPSQLDEEGTQTPSKETIQLAMDLAGNLRKRGLPAPTRILPDVHG